MAETNKSKKVKAPVHKPSEVIGKRTMREPKDRKKIFVATICKFCEFPSSMIIYVDPKEIEGTLGQDTEVPIQCGFCDEIYTVNLDRNGGVRSY